MKGSLGLSGKVAGFGVLSEGTAGDEGSAHVAVPGIREVSSLCLVKIACSYVL